MTKCPQESSSLGNMMLGLLFGAAIGGIFALLYAPKAGKETRDELIDRMNELKVRVDQTTTEVTELVKARLAETRADLTQAVEAGRAAAKDRATELRKESGLG